MPDQAMTTPVPEINLIEPSPVDERCLAVTGWVCEPDGLHFATEAEARAHDRTCGRARIKTLAALQEQMDRTAAQLATTDTLLGYAKARIAEAASYHTRVRKANDAARERAEQARQLWATQARAQADAVLGGTGRGRRS